MRRGVDVARFWVGEQEVDTLRRTMGDGRAFLTLSPIEADLLAYLYGRLGQPVPREELLEKVWGYRTGVQSRTVDTTLSRLRQKIEPDPRHPAFIRTHRGLGIELRGVTESRVAEPWRVRVSYPQGPELVGRRGLLAEVRGRLQGAGIWALVGPGGVGKTALAQAILREWDDGSSSPLFFDLSTCRTSAEVLSVVAETIAGTATSQLPDTLREALGRLARPLVVADATEDLEEHAATQLLEVCRDVPLILTSRRTRPGVEVVRIPALEVGDARELMRSLVDRTGQVVTDGVVAAAVEHAGALPLGLELLAPALDLLGPDVGRWSLDVEDPTRSERHRSLAAVFEAGFRALEPLDRDIFAICGVFRGEFDVAGVCAATAESPVAVLASLTRLRDRSWVISDGGTMRLARPARDFALRQLGDRRAEVRARVDAWFQGEEESLTLGDPLVWRPYRHELLDALERARSEDQLALLRSIYIASLTGGWVPEAVARLRPLPSRWVEPDRSVLQVVLAALERQLRGDHHEVPNPELPAGSLQQALVRGVQVSLTPGPDEALAFLRDTQARTEPAILYMRCAAASSALELPEAQQVLRDLDRSARERGWAGLRRSTAGLLALVLAGDGDHERALAELDALQESLAPDPVLFIPRIRLHVLFQAGRLASMIPVARRIGEDSRRAHLEIHARAAWVTEAAVHFALGDRDAVARMLDVPETGPLVAETGSIAVLRAWVEGVPLADLRTDDPEVDRIVEATLAGMDPRELAGEDLVMELFARGLNEGCWSRSTGSRV